MAYIWWGTKLPSGEESTAFVIGGPTGVSNETNGKLVKYQEIRDWFKTKTDSEIKENLKQRLELNNEELEFVCERLFDERDKGEWDKPFEFEEKYKDWR